MKLKELKELTAEELQKRSRELKEEMLNLRLQQGSEQLENTARIRTVRREIARVQTLLNEPKPAAGE
ncbi:50S ribosomal protein L29 [Sulfuriroseicoccus oceanibius]|uniref:Large ribosomal subunit protein uL29 n=1 Tax=Sulfuriroseicoccus oceanibius TaxID=2707525 RepID=A0A6B3L533_9BACT|nr:50S ribosomal protein L29 [Sulfuriroseicoccus oceanibius]QQL45829.1 50S ribosomal protein L29 [Sulfuriroseicoccus oceanibius]